MRIMSNGVRDAALLEELGQTFGVSINDGLKMWRCDGQSFERRFRRVDFTLLGLAGDDDSDGDEGEGEAESGG